MRRILTGNDRKAKLIQAKLPKYDGSGALLNGTLYYGRYSEGCYYIFILFLSHQVKFAKIQDQEVRRCLRCCAFLFGFTWARSAMPYVSRDGRLVFVPADASSISDRSVILETLASRKRSIELLSGRGRSPHPHDGSQWDDRDGPSAFESAAIVSTVPEFAGHGAPAHSAACAIVDASGVSTVACAPNAAGDGPEGAAMGVGSVAEPAGQRGQRVMPPPEAVAPEASQGVSFAGGVHLHINAQHEQASMASWLSRGYEGRLCTLLVDMCVTLEEVSPEAPMDMIGVLSCPPNSFGRHTALLVDRAGSILQALARMRLPVLRPPLSTALVVVEQSFTLPPPHPC